MNDLVGKLEKALKKDDLVLLSSDSDTIEEMKPEMLEKLSGNQEKSVVYVSVTRPYDSIVDQLDSAGIDTDKIFFIDCMSKTQDPDNIVRADNCVFIDPRNLTNISIAISEAVENVPENSERVLIFDTLSALRVYNEDKPLEQFGQFLSSKIHNWGIKSIIFALENEADDRLIARISQFCDCKVKTP